MKHSSGYDEVQSYFGGHARLLRFKSVCDHRGRLLPFNFEVLPFLPQRIFWVSHVPAGSSRGEHAHQYGSQMMFCLSGEVDILMRTEAEEAEVCLAENSLGLLIGAGVWAKQTYKAEQATLLVLASERYNPASYMVRPRALP
jgi:dTDP-4-dehydrorhamnose 3,5-epimerase-like enzyme